MAGQVRLDDPATLRQFAAEVTDVQRRMQSVGDFGEVLASELVSSSPHGTPPEVGEALADLAEAATTAARNATEFYRKGAQILAGLAYRAAYVAANLPEADLEAKRRLTAVVDQAASAVPTPPAQPR